MTLPSEDSLMKARVQKKQLDAFPTFLEKVTILIKENLHEEDFGVDRLHEALNISYPHFYRKIKQTTGLTPSLLIRQLRLQRAAYFLVQSDLQIREIAFQVGFNTPNYFNTCFLEHYGCTPSVYRKNNTK